MGAPTWHAPAASQVDPSVQANPSSHGAFVRILHSPSFGPPSAVEQASHCPRSQALSQHTPSTQKPLGQSFTDAHASPRAVP